MFLTCGSPLCSFQGGVTFLFSFLSFREGFSPAPLPLPAAGYACAHVPGRRLWGAGVLLPLHLCSQSHPKARSGSSVVAPGPLAVRAPSMSPCSRCARLGPAAATGRGAGAQLVAQAGGMQGRNWVNFGVTSLRLPWGSVSKMMQRNSLGVSTAFPASRAVVRLLPGPGEVSRGAADVGMPLTLFSTEKVTVPTEVDSFRNSLFRVTHFPWVTGVRGQLGSSFLPGSAVCWPQCRCGDKGSI